MLIRLSDHYFKMKVGSADPEEDVMRARAIRETIGPDNVLMMDANQKWDVNVRVSRFAHLLTRDTSTYAGKQCTCSFSCWCLDRRRLRI